MGCSLLSIIEIFYFLANYIVFVVQTKANSKKTSPKPQTWAVQTHQVKLVAAQVTNNEILAALNSLTRTVDNNDLKIRKIVMEKQMLIQKRFARLEQQISEKKE
jgi:hypothetical protein